MATVVAQETGRETGRGGTQHPTRIRPSDSSNRWRMIKPTVEVKELGDEEHLRITEILKRNDSYTFDGTSIARVRVENSYHADIIAQQKSKAHKFQATDQGSRMRVHQPTIAMKSDQLMADLLNRDPEQKELSLIHISEPTRP